MATGNGCYTGLVPNDTKSGPSITKKLTAFEIRIGGTLYYPSKKITFTLYRITEYGPEIVLSDCADKGTFGICVPLGNSTFFYIVVGIHDSSDERVNLLSVFDRYSKFVVISEQTTVANIFCFSNFIAISANCIVDLYSTDTFLGVAHGMRNNFIFSDGEISDVIQGNPNGLETNSYPLFNFIAGMIYYTIVDMTLFDEFLFFIRSRICPRRSIEYGSRSIFKRRRDLCIV